MRRLSSTAPANSSAPTTGPQPFADASAWRYSHHDYLDAAARGHGTPLNTGEPCDAAWDPRLRATISTEAVRVEEEHVLPDLLADLDDHMQGRSRFHGRP